MSLTFPNRSRSFDEARQAVRFSGYDGMFEVPFAVNASALPLGGVAISEEACLSAFDCARDTILDGACRIYSGRRPSLYVITDGDLR